ncbi:DUF5134 domain-containing protein [Streptomyces chumphonensis]|uniref:DUF5134 domain-containing protein n=1 Tax=Streptomyces chumphonensis TaxID=1214925 RepID=UPI003D75B550
MHGPALVGWMLAGVCALAGAVCLTRARRGAVDGTAGRAARRAREAAVAETFMAWSMALMSVPGARLPGPFYVALFAASALWALSLRSRGMGHQLHHLTEAAAMGYLVLSMGADHRGGPAVVTGGLLLYFAGYAVAGGVRLLPAPAPSGGPGPSPSAVLASPGVTDACRLTLALAMCAMLLG